MKKIIRWEEKVKLNLIRNHILARMKESAEGCRAIVRNTVCLKQMYCRTKISIYI